MTQALFIPSAADSVARAVQARQTGNSRDAMYYYKKAVYADANGRGGVGSAAKLEAVQGYAELLMERGHTAGAFEFVRKFKLPLSIRLALENRLTCKLESPFVFLEMAAQCPITLAGVRALLSWPCSENIASIAYPFDVTVPETGCVVGPAKHRAVLELSSHEFAKVVCASFPRFGFRTSLPALGEYSTDALLRALKANSGLWDAAMRAPQ